MSHTTTHVSLYKVTCVVTGRAYIGLSKDPQKRFRQHMMNGDGSAMSEDVRVLGRDAFVLSVLEEVDGYQKAAERERALIAEHQTFHPSGYNRTDGGEFAKNMSARSRKLMSLAKVGKPSPFEGKTHTPSARLRISEGRQGIKQSEEVRMEQGLSRRGNKNSRRTAVHQLTRDGVLVNTFPTVLGASEALGIARNTIHRAMRNQGYTAGGFRWQGA